MITNNTKTSNRERYIKAYLITKAKRYTTLQIKEAKARLLDLSTAPMSRASGERFFGLRANARDVIRREKIGQEIIDMKCEAPSREDGIISHWWENVEFNLEIAAAKLTVWSAAEELAMCV